MIELIGFLVMLYACLEAKRELRNTQWHIIRQMEKDGMDWQSRAVEICEENS